MSYTQFGDPVSFVNLTQEARDALELPFSGLTVFNLDEQSIDVFRASTWGQVQLHTGTPTQGNFPAWDVGTGTWIPASNISYNNYGSIAELRLTGNSIVKWGSTADFSGPNQLGGFSWVNSSRTLALVAPSLSSPTFVLRSGITDGMTFLVSDSGGGSGEIHFAAEAGKLIYDGTTAKLTWSDSLSGSATDIFQINGLTPPTGRVSILNSYPLFTTSFEDKTDVATPGNPAANHTRFYSKAQVPMWLNAAGTEVSLLTSTTGMLNVLTTTGDMVYSSSGTTAARLGIGTSGFPLVSNGTIPTWASTYKAAAIQDTGATTRITIATSTPQISLTGDFAVTGNSLLTGNLGVTGQTALKAASSSANTVIALADTFTSSTASSNFIGVDVGIFANPSSNNTTSTWYGVQASVTTTGSTKNVGALWALRGIASQTSSGGTVTELIGTRSAALSGALITGAAVSAVTDMYGIQNQSLMLNSTAGTVGTRSFGLFNRASMNFGNAGGSTLGTQWGAYVSSSVVGANCTVTTLYGIEIDPTDAQASGPPTPAGTATTPTMLKIDAWPGGTAATNGPFGVSVYGATYLNWIEGPLQTGAATAATRPTAQAAQLIVYQPTLGNAIQTLTSVATNDDPIETVYQNRVTTTDATVTTIHTTAVPANTVVGMQAEIIARRTGGAAGTADDGAFYFRYACANLIGGVATLIGAVSAPITMESVAAYNATIAVSGANLVVQVTGVANTSITWHTTVRVYSVGT